MKKGTLQATLQKYKNEKNNTINNCMSTNQIPWMKWGIFLERCKSPKLIQEETEN